MMISVLIKEAAKPIKMAVLENEDMQVLKEIVEASSNDDVELHIFDHLGAVIDSKAIKKNKPYCCSIDGFHFYGTVIITGTKKYKEQIEISDVILTPELIEHMPAEDRYETEEKK